MDYKYEGPVIVLAPSLPKYSEVWMQRITDMLPRRVVFIALCDQAMVPGMGEGVITHVLRNRGRLPQRVVLGMHRRYFVNQVGTILNHYREGSQVTVLCHYLTTAVRLRELWERDDVRCFVHCHGHDVTWNRRFEAFPMLPAHGFSYAKHVKALIGKVNLIANSRVTRQSLLDFGFPDSDIAVKHLSIDTDRITPHFHSERQALKIVYLGRLTDCKGPLETIRAFEMARDRGLKGTLHLIGDGPLRARCDALAHRSKWGRDIKLYGALPSEQAMKILADADIFSAHNKRSLRTQQEEAFGVAVIEAMAYGVPVVTGRSGGVTETVQHGVTGLLVKPGDVAEHAESLVALYRSPGLRGRMGRAGRCRAEAKFDTRVERRRLQSILNL